MGRSAFFIRLFGCPIKCPWCDSAGTWHPDYMPDKVERYTAGELADKALESRAAFAVITGGEPSIHDLNELTAALSERGLAAHLETSGAFEIKGNFDWVTLSPKWQKLPIQSSIEKASEFKLIVEDGESVEKWIREIDFTGNCPVWLHPEWSQVRNVALLESITQFIKKHGEPFRAGYQMHKLYKADLLDENSQKAVPLGGDPDLGY